MSFTQESPQYNIRTMEYSIYRITCVPAQKSYIGQTQQFKTREGKPYKYGVVGRWYDHVSSSKRSDTPFHTAIREHGIEAFTTETLEVVTEEMADVREAYWIQHHQTVVPNGYNVAEHSRCKHRSATNIVDLYPDATAVEVKHIQRDGVPRLVYVYIDTPAGRKRLTFGQGIHETFEGACQEASEVVKQFEEKGVVIKSSDKKQQFVGKVLERIRIVPFNKTMVAIYLKDTTTETRVCFGGKHIAYEDAVQKAKEFISGLESKSVEDKSATGGSSLG